MAAIVATNIAKTVGSAAFNSLVDTKDNTTKLTAQGEGALMSGLRWCGDTCVTLMGCIAFWVIAFFILLWITWPYVWAFHIPFVSQESFTPDYIYTIAHLGRIKDQDAFDATLKEKQTEGMIMTFPPNYVSKIPSVAKLHARIEQLETSNARLQNRLEAPKPAPEPVKKTEEPIEEITFD